MEDRLAQAATYQETSRWAKVLDQVANVTPTDVRLTSLKVDINAVKGATRTARRIPILSFLVLATLPMKVSTAQTMKLGHIDRNALVMAMPERTAASTKLDAFAKTLEGRLKAMGDEYTSKRAVLENPPATMTQTDWALLRASSRSWKRGSWMRRKRLRKTWPRWNKSC